MITTGSTARPLNGDAHHLRIDQHAAPPADWPVAPRERAIAFGPFRLLPTRRLLLEDGEPVHLGSRALEILIALVERQGELASKSELMARVWPDTFVDEGNLKVQVAGLRRALGDSRGSNQYLATVPGRGYRFVAPLTCEPGPSAPQCAPEGAHRLPAPIAAMIDRVDSVGALTARLPSQRFITVVGPGGIGKTTVALAVARRLIEGYEHGALFVDLSVVADPRRVPDALAAQLGLELCSDHPMPGLIAALADRRMLLVLDNCEHVIDAAAALARDLLGAAPKLQIVATSREPLRVAGEHVHRLPSLASPPASAGLTAAEALRYPAVQLFVERAAAASGAFSFGDGEAPLVADICRRLDGIPLAIELAAARIDALGVRGLAVHLRDPLQLLTGGRRAEQPRQQTMRATLEWGHALLTPSERVVLRRLAIFAGAFTLDAASVVAAGPGIAVAGIIEHLANLVTKSFIAANIDSATPRYRLLETVRAHAFEKLSESGELEQVARRHAEYAHHRVPCTDAERLAACGRQIDDADGVPDPASAPMGSCRSAAPVRSFPAASYL